MASISTQLNIVDRMSSPMYNIIGAVDQMIGSLSDVDGAINSGFDTSPINSARQAIDMTNQQVDEVVANLQRQEQQQSRVNQEIREGSSAMDRMVQGAVSMMAAYASWQGVQQLVGLSDTMTQTTARLNNLNEKLSVTQEEIYAVAQVSRAGFLQTGDMIAKMGLQAEKAFDSGEELLMFGELLNKSMVNAGTSTQGMDSVMLQLTQSMAAGVLQGEELNALLDNAQPIVANIQRYLEEVQNIDASNIKDLASQGVITADVIKNAMFYASEDINKQFESMPMTWGQVWTDMTNSVIYFSQPLLSVISWLANHIEIIAPMVVGLGLAFAVFQIAAHWTTIATVATGAYHAVVNFLSIAFGILTGSTAASSAAMFTFNSALLANPITWVVMLILVLIGLLYAGVAAYNKFTDSAVSATGIVGGAFTALGAHLINTFIVPAQNGFAMIANFLGNVFNNPIAAVQVLFYDMVLTVLGYVANLASGIEDLLNKIPGVTVDITSGLDNLYSNLEEAQKQVKDESGWVEYVEKMNFIDYGDAWDAGYAFGEGIDNTVGDMFGGGDFGDYGTGDFPVGGESLDTIAGNTGDIADSVAISEEDMKYLRDLAEQEAVNRYTTAEIKVDMGGVTNHVSKDTDLDGVMDYLVNGLEEAMAKSAEGVHE